MLQVEINTSISSVEQLTISRQLMTPVVALTVSSARRSRTRDSTSNTRVCIGFSTWGLKESVMSRSVEPSRKLSDKRDLKV